MNHAQISLNNVTHRFNQNNLHIKCTAFSDTQAQTVLQLMKEFHTRCNRIFVDVTEIQTTEPRVVQQFKKELGTSQITPQQVYFKGASGFSIAINGNRVIVRKPQSDTGIPKKTHTCCGRCANCHCHDHS